MKLFGGATLLVVVSSLLPSCSAQNNKGEWSEIINTPLIATAASNLADGKVVIWSANAKTFFGGANGQTWVGVFDPSTGKSTSKLIKDINHDMFCTGTATLADGRIMVAGGSGNAAVSFYDPRRNSWSRGSNMKISRGYQGNTVLDDGSVFTMGGSWGTGGRGGKVGEMWHQVNQEWRVTKTIADRPMATNDSRGIYRADNHMWLFQSPDGRVFHAGPSKQMHWLSPKTGDGWLKNFVKRGNDPDAMNGGVVMYDIGKLLTIGGALHYDSGTATGNTHIIDINGNGREAKVTKVGSLNKARTLISPVVLPTGEVVIFGGQSTPKLFSDRGSVLSAELWSPRTQKWTTMANHKIPRNYHSIGILLKDGRVLAAGGGLCARNCPANHNDAEIFTPPYLLNADGSARARPRIQSAPSTAKGGSRINVNLAGRGDHSFALVKLSAVTHTVNNDNRRVPLRVTRRRGNRSTVAIPGNSAVVPPGYYYLFAMRNGVPSVGHTIRVQPLNRCSKLPPAQQYHLVSKNSKMAIHVPGGSTRAGTGVVQWGIQRSGRANARDNFSLKDTTNNYYQIIGQNSKQALTVRGASRANGGEIVQAPPKNGREFEWCFQDAGDGYYKIFNRRSGLLLDVDSRSKQRGAKILQWPDKNGPNQLWRVEPS